MDRIGKFDLLARSRAQQVRAEIGRLLEQHFEPSAMPMSNSLTEVIKRIEQGLSYPIYSGHEVTDEQSNPNRTDVQ